MSDGILVDTDAFFAIIEKDDSNHERALKIIKELKPGTTFTLLETTIAEAATTLRRKSSKTSSLKFLKYIKSEGFSVFFTDATLLALAETYYLKQRSKKNTFFDCLVMAAAKIYNVDAIFSFDKGYKTNGFKLLG